MNRASLLVRWMAASNFYRADPFFSGFAGACVAAFYLIAVFPRVLADVADTRRGGNAGGGCGARSAFGRGFSSSSASSFDTSPGVPASTLLIFTSRAASSFDMRCIALITSFMSASFESGLSAAPSEGAGFFFAGFSDAGVVSAVSWIVPAAAPGFSGSVPKCMSAGGNLSTCAILFKRFPRGCVTPASHCWTACGDTPTSLASCDWFKSSFSRPSRMIFAIFICRVTAKNGYAIAPCMIQAPLAHELQESLDIYK